MVAIGFPSTLAYGGGSSSARRSARMAVFTLACWAVSTPALAGPPPGARSDDSDAGDAGAWGADEEVRSTARSPSVDAEAPALVELPPVVPDRAVAPVIAGSENATPPENRSIPASARPGAAIRVILGLLALMALAYLGGHRRVLDWERRVGILQVITAGLPFIVLGMIARLPAVGILTDPVLGELSPVLRIGLGSIGFVAGFRFDTKRLQGLPRGTSRIAALATLVPLAIVAGATAPLLLVFSSETWSNGLRDPVFVRDALILATAGAMTARSAARLLPANGAEEVAAKIVRLEELAGVVGLAFVAAFFRPHEPQGGWELPGMGWLLLTIGLGAALGLLFYTILQATPPGPDFAAVTLGAISFAAGAAGYLQLSSVAVSFVAGVIVANFHGTFQPRLREILKRLERPIYFLALFIIGALWQFDDWRGWVLMPVFAIARLFGKALAAAIAARREDMPITAEESRRLAISPLGALAIAIVVNAQLLYPGGSISLVVSTVIGGGVLTEAFVQVAGHRFLRNGGPERSAP